MDFQGNLERTKESIRQAKAQGARYRLGPELETTGYSCEDHFLEQDTFTHSWEVIREILNDPEDLTKDMLVDIGAPVMHKDVRHNCRIFMLNGKIVLIRPKMHMANDGNYRETRFFVAWNRGATLEEYYLPRSIREVTGQDKVPIGFAAVACRDTVIASEICEELFTPKSPHIDLALNGVEIITNGSGSHHQLRKLDKRVALIQGASGKSGGVYMYSNHQGCDGTRLYFDGSAMIAMNGELLAQASQFSTADVEVITATIDLNDVRNMRGAISSQGIQAASSTPIPRVDIDFDLTSKGLHSVLSKPRPAVYHTPEEEIALGPAHWLWDYLRRSGQRGFFLPLSGGADSGATASIVGLMCEYVTTAVAEGDEKALQDVRLVTRDPEYTPTDPRELCSRVLFTCYLGTVNSGQETLDRAANMAFCVGATHTAVKIDDVTTALVDTFMQQKPDGVRPSLYSPPSSAEDLALQNIQARSRMVLSYMMAQLLPWQASGETYPGNLLVLGSANVDEALRGYYTKYDCSAADVNPIGGIAKMDLKAFLRYVAQEKGWDAARDIVEAVPTAELRPLDDGKGGEVPSQTDEEDMGMSYNELKVYGALRSYSRCGPVAMFHKLVHEWGPGGCHPDGYECSPQEVAEKVKRFFKFYSINRHKMTTLTPSYHAENYSPDDNRFDLRQFLYPSRWEWQFGKIDKIVKEMGK